jgi:hypothetical protein
MSTPTSSVSSTTAPAVSSSSSTAPTSVSSSGPASPDELITPLVASTTKREDTNFTDLKKFKEWEISMVKCASSPEEAQKMGSEWYDILEKFIRPNRMMYDVFVLEKPFAIHLLVYADVTEENKLARVRCFIGHTASSKQENAPFKYWTPSPFTNAVSINMSTQEKLSNFMAVLQATVDQCVRFDKLEMTALASEVAKIEASVHSFLQGYNVVGYQALHSIY